MPSFANGRAITRVREWLPSPPAPFVHVTVIVIGAPPAPALIWRQFAPDQELRVPAVELHVIVQVSALFLHTPVQESRTDAFTPPCTTVLRGSPETPKSRPARAPTLQSPLRRKYG